MKIKNSTSTLVGLLILALLSAWSSSAATVPQLETELKKNPNKLTIREALGRTYVKGSKYQKAIDLLAPYSNEISNESLVELATAYSKSNDSLNEIRMLQIYTEKDSRRFRPHYLLGLALKNAKKYDDATKSLRQAIELAPQHRPSYQALLEIFIETKQNYESRTLLNEMIRSFGQKNEFISLMCKLFATDNFLNEALDTCKKAIQQDPQFSENHIYLAQTYYNQGNKVAAEKIFKNAGRQFQNSEFVQYAAGEFYLNEKNFPASVRYLQTAVKVNPKTMRSQITLANALFETRDYKNALVHFELSCKLDKSSDTLTALKNAAAKLRQMNQSAMGELYGRKAAVCQ